MDDAMAIRFLLSRMRRATTYFFLLFLRMLALASVAISLANGSAQATRDEKICSKSDARDRVYQNYDAIDVISVDYDHDEEEFIVTYIDRYGYLTTAIIYLDC